MYASGLWLTSSGCMAERGRDNNIKRNMKKVTKKINKKQKRMIDE